MSDDQIMQLGQYWPYQATVLARLVSKHTSSVIKRHGDLNLSQWRVLAAVAEKDGRTSAEVVAVTPMDKGIVSRAAASLIDEGLLRKKNDLGDKRRSRLLMTKPGRKIYQAIRKDLMAETGSVAVSDKLNAHLLEVIERMKTLEE